MTSIKRAADVVSVHFTTASFRLVTVHMASALHFLNWAGASLYRSCNVVPNFFSLCVSSNAKDTLKLKFYSGNGPAYGDAKLFLLIRF